MILYVAGPMTGLPEFNYPAFNAAARMLAGFGYDVLNPVDAEQHNPTPGTPQAWDWYMRHALRMVLQADGIALLTGWENSRGAAVEVFVAHALGIDALPLEDWVERAA
jgi:nucleoside 2-deoxyribosyltransferase